MQAPKKLLLWTGGALLGIALLFLLMPYIAVLFLTLVYGGLFAAMAIGQGSVGFALASVLFAFGTRIQNARLLFWMVLGPIVGLGIATAWYGGPIETQPDLWRANEYVWALPLALVILLAPRAHVRWGGPLLALVLATTPMTKAILLVKESTDWSSGLLAGIGVPAVMYILTMMAFAAGALALGALARGFANGLGLSADWVPRILGIGLLMMAIALRWSGLVRG
jgi:hypothetical protein